MKRLTIGVIVAALAYSAFWFWSAHTQKTAIEAWFQDRRSDGWASDYSEITVKGFPNRLDTTIEAPRLGDPTTGVMWESPFLQLFRLSYNPSHLIAVAANEQTFATPEAEIGVKTSDLRASFEISDLASWTPERIIVVAEDISLEATTGWTTRAEVAQISTETADDLTYRAALDVRALNATIPGLIDAASTNSQIDRLFVDAEVELDRSINRSSIERSRQQPKSIALKLAEAEWNGLNLAAAGKVEVTGSGTPIGVITLKVHNWRDMLDKERRQNRLSARAINQIELTLALISGLSGNPETLDLPFEFKSNGIWLGPLRMGDAPKLAIP